MNTLLVILLALFLLWNLREAAVIRRQREILRQFDRRARGRVVP